MTENYYRPSRTATDRALWGRVSYFRGRGYTESTVTIHEENGDLIGEAVKARGRTVEAARQAAKVFLKSHGFRVDG